MPDDIQIFDEQPVGRFPTRPLSDARISAYRVMPWPDATRVTVEMTMTPFREFPDFDVLIVSQTGENAGEVLRQSSMVASMERQPAPYPLAAPFGQRHAVVGRDANFGERAIVANGRGAVRGGWADHQTRAGLTP